jgi:hypothetical protein
MSDQDAIAEQIDSNAEEDQRRSLMVLRPSKAAVDNSDALVNGNEEEAAGDERDTIVHGGGPTSARGINSIATTASTTPAAARSAKLSKRRDTAISSASRRPCRAFTTSSPASLSRARPSGAPSVRMD